MKDKVVRNRTVRPFDVDGTLIVLYDPTVDANCYIDIPDPIYPGKIIRLRKNNAMIRLMLEEKHRGSYILVWSRGGYEWAETVIRALDLYDVVDIIMDKPLAYFDDMEVSRWLKDRVFIGPDEKYKE